SNGGSEEELGDAVALQGVSKFPVRVKCATLSWHTLEEAFKTSEKK
ncbi:MAG: SUF system NifU family Fe-S cluster assembly protein, partial [Candidatus Kryptoniota bacterium]